MPRKKPPQTEVLDKVETPKVLAEVIKDVSDGAISQRMHHLFRQGSLSKMESSKDIAEQYDFCYLLLLFTEFSESRIKTMMTALDGVSKHYERFINKEEPQMMRDIVEEFASKNKIMLDILKKDSPQLYNKVMAEIEKNAKNSSK
jgi:hypothetical protein